MVQIRLQDVAPLDETGELSVTHDRDEPGRFQFLDMVGSVAALTNRRPRTSVQDTAPFPAPICRRIS